MAKFQHSALQSAITVLSGGLDALANGAHSAASTAVDNANSANRFLLGDFELTVTFGTAPTAGKTCDLYLLASVDGSNYPEGGGATAPAFGSYAASIPVRAVNTAQRLTIVNVALPAGLFKVVLTNNTGQAMSASGHVLKLAMHTLETP